MPAPLWTKKLAPRIRNLARQFRHYKRVLANTDNKVIANYFDTHQMRKLHVGCGANVLPGWLNSDYFPESSQILHLDATKPFPFGTKSFAYVFSEHMIEHISYSQGAHMLAECHRILAPGGKIRIATPDIAFLVALYREDKSEVQRKYLRWSADTLSAFIPYDDEIFVINNFFKCWGHQFIYSAKLLRDSLEQAGFTAVTSCDLNESEDKELRNLENESRLPPGFLRLETIIFEGVKQY